MSLQHYINQDLIWIDAPLSSTDQLFETVAKTAFELGFVGSDFLTKIKQRECHFPTGLKYQNHAIAIPHTDPCTIKKQFVAIVIPQGELYFRLMDDSEEQAAVDIVFILGLDNSESQLSTLQEIVEFVQDSNKIEQLISYKTVAELFNAFQPATLRQESSV